MQYKLITMLLSGLVLQACSSDKVEVIELGKMTSCDASIVSCQFESDTANLNLRLGPDVKPLKSFNVELEVRSQTIHPEKIIVDFQMVGMDMGMNRYQMLHKGSSWEGVATLPVCTASRTDWVALVEMVERGRIYRVSFPFHTE